MASKTTAVALPPFAPFPATSIRISLGPAEWEACLDAWSFLAEQRIRLSKPDFAATAKKDLTLATFLSSFYHECANAQVEDASLRSPTVQLLQKASFKLTARMILEIDYSSRVLFNWDFLYCFCLIHRRSKALQQLMKTLWNRKADSVNSILQSQKDQIIKSFDSSQSDIETKMISQLVPVVHASPAAGSILMTGSDFLDALEVAYMRSPKIEDRRSVVYVACLGLLSLVKIDVPNLSLLSDHLYAMKAEADRNSSNPTLLAAAVTNTTLLHQLRQSIGVEAPERLRKLLDSLASYRSESVVDSHGLGRRQGSNTKGKQKATHGSMSIHQTSLISQIQDLFPDLGSGFILKLLDAYDDDIEQITAHLLDDSLPPHLASLDRSEQMPAFDDDAEVQVEHLAPRSTPPPSFIPERRNVFDNDELDRLEVDTSRLHIGKRDRTQDRGSSAADSKAAVLSALAAFDSDDDERDDTYDVDDVGGTVDAAHPDGEPAAAARQPPDHASDLVLYAAYTADPGVFARTSEARRHPKRAALKTDIGMTDEALEGWAVMLQRDPRRLKRLEAQAHGGAGWDGRQPDLPSTSYREPQGGTEDDESDAALSAGERGRGRGRSGRGRGGRGRGAGRGGTAATGADGAADGSNSSAAHRRKEANKGSRANHNRRDQRAKKMNRGGGFL